MSLFSPARMPEHVVRETCACGATLVARSWQSQVVALQAAEFRAAHSDHANSPRAEKRKGRADA